MWWVRSTSNSLYSNHEKLIQRKWIPKIVTNESILSEIEFIQLSPSDSQWNDPKMINVNKMNRIQLLQLEQLWYVNAGGRKSFTQQI